MPISLSYLFLVHSFRGLFIPEKRMGIFLTRVIPYGKCNVSREKNISLVLKNKYEKSHMYY